MIDFDVDVRTARRSVVRRMEREQSAKRRKYEAELRRQGVPEERREELLAELDDEHRKRRRSFERRFCTSLRPGDVAP